jgi:hypothetical protein
MFSRIVKCGNSCIYYDTTEQIIQIINSNTKQRDYIFLTLQFALTNNPHIAVNIIIGKINVDFGNNLPILYTEINTEQLPIPGIDNTKEYLFSTYSEMIKINDIVFDYFPENSQYIKLKEHQRTLTNNIHIIPSFYNKYLNTSTILHNKNIDDIITRIRSLEISAKPALFVDPNIHIYSLPEIRKNKYNIQELIIIKYSDKANITLNNTFNWKQFFPYASITSIYCDKDVQLSQKQNIIIDDRPAFISTRQKLTSLLCITPYIEKGGIYILVGLHVDNQCLELDHSHRKEIFDTYSMNHTHIILPDYTINNTSKTVPVTIFTRFPNIYSVLMYSHDYGFFSTCSVILHNISSITHTYSHLPSTIDMKHMFTWYKSSNSDKEENISQYYFKPITPAISREYTRDNLQPARNQHRFGIFRHYHQFALYSDLDFQYLTPIIRAIFEPAQCILDIVHNIEIKYGLSKITYNKVCTLFYRGNDKRTEIQGVEYNALIDRAKALLDMEPDTRIIIQSDESEFIDTALKSFPNNAIIFRDEIRHMPRTDNSTVDIVFSENNHYFSKQYLAITLIMAKCNTVICTTGNCSLWIALFRGHAKGIQQL